MVAQKFLLKKRVPFTALFLSRLWRLVPGYFYFVCKISFDCHLIVLVDALNDYSWENFKQVVRASYFSKYLTLQNCFSLSTHKSFLIKFLKVTGSNLGEFASFLETFSTSWSCGYFRIVIRQLFETEMRYWIS